MNWFKTIFSSPSAHRGNTSCSTKAQMNTNPEGLSIKLHLLTAPFLMHNIMSSALCVSSIILTKDEGSKWILLQHLPKHCLSSSLKKAGESPQLISERWQSLSADLTRQSFLSASATRHYWSLNSRESNLQQIEKLLEAHLRYSKLFCCLHHGCLHQGPSGSPESIERCGGLLIICQWRVHE